MRFELTKGTSVVHHRHVAEITSSRRTADVAQW